MKQPAFKYITCACLFALAGSAFGEWIEVDKTYQDEVTYIDPSRTRNEGAMTYYWTMSSYSHPRLLLGKSVTSQVNQAVIDCKRQLAATLFFAWYDGPNATGENVNTMNIPEEKAKLLPIVPNSIGDKEAKIACTAQVRSQ